MVNDENNLLKQVAEIEKETFFDAWSLNAIKDTMRHDYNVIFVADSNCADEVTVRIYRGGDEFEAEICLYDKSVSGYLMANMISFETELLRIAVKEESRGMGTGKLLMSAYLNYMEGICTKSFLEVRDKNTVARMLYQSVGYKNISIRKNYYSAPVDDAVIYEYKFDSVAK